MHCARVAIPPPHATVLANWRRQVGDANADLVWPHVTLLPPTPVPAELLTDVEEHLRSAALAQEPFAMHLAGTGTFRPTSPVVFEHLFEDKAFSRVRLSGMAQMWTVLARIHR